MNVLTYKTERDSQTDIESRFVVNKGKGAEG